MRTEDYDLTLEEVQELSSRDALAAFFARLGYDSNVSMVKNVAAMGITNDNLKATITHIERLAIQSVLGFDFEIYLFELKSVTVATTQAIVRTFRNRPGDYLLVLTKDYQQLDFVLVERFNQLPQPQQDTPGITSASTKQVGVQPRVLTVNRRTPDPVALRVLRRFTCTESDTFAQYDKLISAYDVAYWSKPYFNNRALFSDYYLTERLPRSPEWDNAQEALNMTRTAQKLSSLYVDVRETFANQKEAVVRANLLEPVLTCLGFTLRSMSAGGESTQPDYLLFADTAATKPQPLSLAYTWNPNLDGKDETRDDVTPDENPGAAVVTLLDSGQADWAIVTNAKIWRLYSAKATSRSTNYYDIHLEETFALPKRQPAEAFRYFCLLFRVGAFITTERKHAAQLRQIGFPASPM